VSADLEHLEDVARDDLLSEANDGEVPVPISNGE